jgi:hypothetical protein
MQEKEKKHPLDVDQKFVPFGKDADDEFEKATENVRKFKDLK